MSEPPSKPRLVESCRYNFTAEEIRHLGESLAREAQNVFTLRQEKKEISQSYASRIEEANGKVAALTDKINQGYEMRDTECRVELDRPRRGAKSIVRVDTGAVVREEAMTAAEMQEAFRFDDAPGGEDEESQPRKRRPRGGGVN
jgi:deoxyribodipyrimidine photolyase